MKRELLRMEHVSLIRNGEALLDNLNLQIFAGALNRTGQRTRSVDQPALSKSPDLLWFCLV